MRYAFAIIVASTAITLLSNNACAQTKRFLDEDRKQLAARYLSRMQQVAGMQATTMSSTKSREQALDVINQAAVQIADARFGTEASEPRSKSIASSSAALLKMYEQVKDRLPSRYSDWFTFSLLTERSKDVQAAMRALKLKAPAPILVGDIPTTCINAMAVRVPNASERLILVKSGMINSTWHVMNLASESVGFDSSGAPDTMLPTIRARIRNRKMAAAFTYALSASSGDIPKGAPPEDPARATLSTYLHRSATLFVLAHEFAHVLLKHTEENTRSFTVKSAVAEGPPRAAIIVDTAKNSRAQEFAADRLGLELLIKAAQLAPDTSQRMDVMVWAPEVLFAWLELFETAVSEFTDQPRFDYAVADHPSPLERLTALRAHRTTLGYAAPALDGFLTAWKDRIGLVRDVEPMRRMYARLVQDFNVAECQ